MNAAVYYGIKDLRVEETEVPGIGDGDVLLRVNACAICGTDVKVYNYGYKTLEPPAITGHEISGTIVEAGGKVQGHVIGERVCVVPIVSCGHCYYCRRGLTHLCIEFARNTEAFGFSYPGGFAEYMAVPEKAVRGGNLVRVPDDVSDEEASIAEPMACALNGQMLAGVGIGDTVLVIGAGPIGCMHATLSRALGATTVIVSEPREERLEQARRFGADYFVNPQKEDLKTIVMEKTGGIGANVVMIAAGSKAAQESALELSANRAHIDFFGGLPRDDSTVRLDSNRIHYKEVYIHGSSGCTALQIQTCIDLMKGKRVDGKRFISRVISLEELPKMVAEAGTWSELKVVVKP
ncbi:MAG: zinc-dependent dehydrogenase [Spirochaetes bacterium]|nr:zinc-dependent dehydrogenase [Spirochaetota bacterium]